MFILLVGHYLNMFFNKFTCANQRTKAPKRACRSRHAKRRGPGRQSWEHWHCVHLIFSTCCCFWSPESQAKSIGLKPKRRISVAVILFFVRALAILYPGKHAHTQAKTFQQTQEELPVCSVGHIPSQPKPSVFSMNPNMNLTVNLTIAIMKCKHVCHPFC